ncbi:MAG: bifunctional rhamnulose-1-phosphate aldolase/short-chain dehydrogenase [Candidatus Electryonea clarkiae]|nr:bifunctional rhamnulose-1-phosphate aldolase/short-chain dehydrogenase [Candidatus Electryonea clarkiae]MDP8286597.1 bifunctional rhamnulose-1-phosphate aldolase/short-chain dehydrogenase [Candidatus Electryonea clarkiae]
MELKFLDDQWEAEYASQQSEEIQLCYRSNLLGSDLRITNFGGGNTSSKISNKDPLSGLGTSVLWVKGSGGDLGSMQLDGFSRLYMNKLLDLKSIYRGVEYEDEMVGLYPLCGFGPPSRPSSIDTSLHAFLPFKHVDHTHPDWAIALAASANGQKKMAAFNERFNRKLTWLPWQRPGFELGLMLEKAVQDNPDCDGIILASHGLFTWGETQYECYRNTIEIIDQLGQFIVPDVERRGDTLFGGAQYDTLDNRIELATEILPFIRGLIGENKKQIADYNDLPEVLRFVNSIDGGKLAYQGTSCPDHFIRTKIRPLYIPWNPESGDVESLKEAIHQGVNQYRVDYREYYEQNKHDNSPAIRDKNPSVVLIAGIGMFSFGKSKKEARITGEFYINAIHVMEGATALEDGELDDGADSSLVINNYLSLHPQEAFNIEYWLLEEAKLQRMPREKEHSRQVVMVVGGGSGIGREFCYRLIGEGAHVAVADINLAAAEKTCDYIEKRFGKELALPVHIDIADRKSVQAALSGIIQFFGGVDHLVNTAAVISAPDRGNSYLDSTWDKILRTNITGNFILVEEFAEIVNKQSFQASVVLTGSANAVVPKSGSEPYDVSKAAVNHLIRELAIRYAPSIRINGVSPATVVEGSTMFPRNRVIANLNKYDVSFDENEETDALVQKLAEFYANRTLSKMPIRPRDIVEAGLFMLSEKSSRTTGHVFPVDGGLPEAFMR